MGSGLSGAPDNGTAYLQATTGARLAFRFTEFALFNLVSFDVAEYWGYNGTANAAMLQTNGPGGGIGTNWATVPGSTVTNLVVVPIDPANGSVFYRLALP